jgi:uncharacterized protein YueI
MPKHLMEFQMGTLAERVAEALEQAQATALTKTRLVSQNIAESALLQ